MKLTTGLLLLATTFFSTPAHAYQILHIPPDNLNLIFCGNGNVFPWVTTGPDAEMMMHANAVGLCNGTITPNVDLDVRHFDMKRLLREQRPAKFSEDKLDSPARKPNLRLLQPLN